MTLDGDHSYPVDGISYLLEAFLHLDVDFLNASRFPVHDSSAMSFKHKFGNLVLSLAMSILFFRWVRDSQSGMWVLRRSILKDMKLEADGMAFSEEIKIEALRHPRIRFGEISIHVFLPFGGEEAEPVARWLSEPRFSAEETVLPMSITAIVPVWNGRELLERLLASLEAQTEPAAELLVVDNGSTDGAPEVARARGARVIPMGRNAGFAAAVNRGIRESRGEWMAVLNSDVELAPDYLARLLAAAEAGGAWFATGKILAAGSNDRIDGTFDAMCRGGTAWRVGNGRTDGPAFSAERQIWSPPFTAVLFRAEVFRRVGLLEDSFESYLEDVDFGLRCAAQGLAGLYVPSALAWHRGSATLGRWHPETVRRMARNQLFLVARHYPRRLLRGLVLAHRGGAVPVGRGGPAARRRLRLAARRMAGVSPFLRCARPDSRRKSTG